MESEEIKKMKLVLLQSAKNFLGISNLPDSNDLNLMIDFLSTHFKGITSTQVYSAMSMYASGTISVPTQPYGVLSMKFLSDLIHEFRMYEKMRNDLKKLKEKNQNLLESHPVNSDETNENLYKWIVEHIKENKIIPELYAWNEVYLHLEKTKEIDLTTEDKIDYLNLIRDELKEKINYYSTSSDHREQVKEWMKILSNDFALASYCRKKLVHLHLNKFINQTNN